MERPGDSLAYKLVKDGHAWDYSTHLADVYAWQEKILREDPEATVTIQETTYAELYRFKTGDLDD